MDTATAAAADTAAVVDTAVTAVLRAPQPSKNVICQSDVHYCVYSCSYSTDTRQALLPTSAADVAIAV